MALIGYARVSTSEQNLDLQRKALILAGCEQNNIFEDLGVSAIAKSRPGFDSAIASMQYGDVLVIWKFDRAFRSVRNALDVLDLFQQRGLEFKCLTEAIDTTTPMGKCMYTIRNAFAELERDIISERTKAGLEIARQNGKHLGRRRKLSQRKTRALLKMKAQQQYTHKEIAKEFGISTRTLSRILNEYTPQKKRTSSNDNTSTA